MHALTRLTRRLSTVAAAGAVIALTLVGTGTAASAQTAPTAVTTAATSVTGTSAVLNGSVNPNSASTTYYFQYGTTAAYGLATQSFAAGPGSLPVAVSASVTGLTANTTYYFQVVATNADGSSSGGQLTLLTTGNVLVTSSRLSGADRYQTSAQIAEAKYPGGVTSGNVVIATGQNFPDALAGNYLAGQLSAPILLSPSTTSDPAWPTVTTALTALNPTHIYIVGGLVAIGADVQTALAQTYTVVRIAGATRYDTMQQVNTYSNFVPGNGATGLRTAIIATGANFPDALAAGPLSAPRTSSSSAGRRRSTRGSSRSCRGSARSMRSSPGRTAPIPPHNSLATSSRRSGSRRRRSSWRRGSASLTRWQVGRSVGIPSRCTSP
jgi:hypothetical protein